MLAIAVAFLLLGLHQLGTPLEYKFDEGFYVPSAVRLGQGLDIANREHPMLAKEMLAGWFLVVGVSPVTWRLLPLLCGAISIYAAGSAMPDRKSGRILAGLQSLNILLFALARVAMLEVFCFMFSALAAWAFRTRRYAISGGLLGLAIAVKWSAAPLLACFLALFLYRFPKRVVRGILLFAALPLLVYLATYVPATLISGNPLKVLEILPLQWAMLSRHEFIDPPHPYAANVTEWILNSAYLRDGPSGSWTVIAGNPAVMLPVVPAVIYGSWRKWPESFIYVIIILFWIASGKNNQFIYHYIIASAFGAAALARILAMHFVLRIGLFAIAVGFFALSYPALIDQPLPVHDRLWPAKPGTYRKLNSVERLEFEQKVYCLNHPSDCFTAFGSNIGASTSRSSWN